MKKHILTLVAAVGALSAISVMAQGTIDLNSFDGAAGAGITLRGTNGAPLPNGYGYIEVWGGANAGSLQPIVSVGLSSAIYPVGTGAAGPGAFDAGYGVVNGLGANSNGVFVIEVWNGASSYAGAQGTAGAFWGTSGTFASTTGTVIPPPPGAPIPGTLNSLADIQVTMTAIPEPATFALAGLSAASLLIFRRRK
jgi:hypothetical protein